MEISLNMLHECLMRIMDSNQLLGWGKKASYESKSKDIYLFFTSLRLEREKNAISRNESQERKENTRPLFRILVGSLTEQEDTRFSCEKDGCLGCFLQRKPKQLHSK